MIKLEHVVLPSPEQMEFVIEGMHNPMNSWDKNDNFRCTEHKDCTDYDTCNNCPHLNESFGSLVIGNNNLSLMQKLSAAGTDHRKFMRMMPVMVRITAPLYWWKEFDTYKVGTVANSCSTMHKIAEKEFEFSDISDKTQDLAISSSLLRMLLHNLNISRERFLETNDKKYWWQMIQLLPSSYNQTRNVMLNYEVLKNMYHSRKKHKLDEWVEFCEWIETLPYSELITGGVV